MTTAVMRHETRVRHSGQRNCPHRTEVELGRGRANGLVHVHSLPPRAALFVLLFQTAPV